MTPTQRKAAERLMEQMGNDHRGYDPDFNEAAALLRELLAEPVLSVKRREWKTLSPEAQAKLNAMSGDPGPEYWRQQALGAERARKVRLR